MKNVSVYLQNAELVSMLPVQPQRWTILGSNKQTGNFNLKAQYLLTQAVPEGATLTESITPSHRNEDDIDELAFEMYDAAGLEALDELDIFTQEEESSEMYYLQYYAHTLWNYFLFFNFSG